MSDTATVEDVYGCPTIERRGQTVVFVPRERYLEVIGGLQNDGYNMCIDVTAVDYLKPEQSRTLPDGVAPERFEVVVNLLSMAQKKRIRIRTQVPTNDVVVPSLFDFYPGCEAMEREVFDLMGIRFSDHPDLTRILMPEDWEGHPLRKDYAQGRIPVQFKYTQNQYETERQS
jgi:NADH-quinone oxidoreductase subunit C